MPNHSESLSVSAEHICWLKASRKTFADIREQACIARLQAGLEPIPILTGDDCLVAFAQAWEAL